MDKHQFVNRITVMIILMLQEFLKEKDTAESYIDHTICIVANNREKFKEAFNG